jgi:4-hydroxy-tetrahydrodipicolinate synthase
MGVDGILAIMEAYFPVPDSGVIRYFSEIVARAVSCPVTLYTNPNFQRVDLTIDPLKSWPNFPTLNMLKTPPPIPVGCCPSSTG